MGTTIDNSQDVLDTRDIIRTTEGEVTTIAALAKQGRIIYQHAPNWYAPRSKEGRRSAYFANKRKRLELKRRYNLLKNIMEREGITPILGVYLASDNQAALCAKIFQQILAFAAEGKWKPYLP